MALHDLARADLDQDAHRIVVVSLDDWSHVAGVSIVDRAGWVRDIDSETARRLVEEKVLLPAPHLTEQRTYVHQQARLFAPA